MKASSQPFGFDGGGTPNGDGTPAQWKFLKKTIFKIVGLFWPFLENKHTGSTMSVASESAHSDGKILTLYVYYSEEKAKKGQQ